MEKTHEDGVSLTEEELLRYQRQIIIPHIGQEGQKKIKESKVFLAGIGGLGSISSYYLVAAGIGYLKLVDRDNVDLGNLNRQIVHWTTDIGAGKADSAINKLRKLNPNCHIDGMKEEICESNIVDLVGDCSIIVDATDNIETRKVLNRASFRMGIPFVYGGVNELNGMITTFIPRETPCFECVFPHSESQKKPIGVLGPLPALVAALQTLEVLKIILNIGALLKGRLLFFSGIDMTFKEIKIEKNPDCKVCNSPRGV